MKDSNGNWRMSVEPAKFGAKPVKRFTGSPIDLTDAVKRAIKPPKPLC